MASAILDSSAVLALLNAERGADAVSAIINDAMILTVNYAEVVSKLVERGASYSQAEVALRTIDLQVVDFDLALAQRTGAMRAETRHLGLSLADRACLALAERERRPALTADRSWSNAVAGIDVHVIR